MEALYEQLGTIYARLGAPSATQLYVSAIRQGLEISKKQAQDFVARQQDKQLFAKAPTSDSKTAIRSEKETVIARERVRNSPTAASHWSDCSAGV